MLFGIIFAAILGTIVKEAQRSYFSSPTRFPEPEYEQHVPYPHPVYGIRGAPPGIIDPEVMEELRGSKPD